MKLDIDFNAKTAKAPLYSSLIILGLFVCLSTPLKNLFIGASCVSAESLQKFYFGSLGLTEGFVNGLSEIISRYLPYFYLFGFVVLTDNKFFALIQIIAMQSRSYFTQSLKGVFQESRPAWSCQNLGTNLCSFSFGNPGSDVWITTMVYLNIIHFGFVHVSFFQKNQQKIWPRVLQSFGIAFCCLVIFIQHQIQVVLGSHSTFQNYYGFFGGCIQFYLIYFYFYPWAMNQNIHFERKNTLKLAGLFFIGFSAFFWSLFLAAKLGFSVSQEMQNHFIKNCLYSLDAISFNFVNFDYTLSSCIFSGLFLLFLLPLKPNLPQGYSWKLSLYLLPLLLLCYFFSTQDFVLSLFPLNDSSSMFLSLYTDGLWKALWLGAPFIFMAFASKNFKKQESTKKKK